MERFPLILEGRSFGELTVSREALYTCFAVSGRLPDPGLWCAWVIGERGELRLGVLEPTGEQAVIRRRFSNQATAFLGKVVGAALRPAGEVLWEQTQEPERLFRTPWLCRQLRGVRGAFTRKEQDWRLLALPYDGRSPFPLPGLFCFANICGVQGRRCVVYAFDEKEQPCFR